MNKFIPTMIDTVRARDAINVLLAELPRTQRFDVMENEAVKPVLEILGIVERDTSQDYKLENSELVFRDMPPTEWELRTLLAHAHRGVDLYTDDGELQSRHPAGNIDFLRDSVEQIRRIILWRAVCGVDLSAEIERMKQAGPKGAV